MDVGGHAARAGCSAWCSACYHTSWRGMARERPQGRKRQNVTEWDASIVSVPCVRRDCFRICEHLLGPAGEAAVIEPAERVMHDQMSDYHLRPASRTVMTLDDDRAVTCGICPPAVRRGRAAAASGGRLAPSAPGRSGVRTPGRLGPSIVTAYDLDPLKRSALRVGRFRPACDYRATIEANLTSASRECSPRPLGHDSHRASGERALASSRC